jgi:hypothetical protein
MHTVQPHANQRQRDTREEQRQRREEPLTHRLRLLDGCLCPNVADTELRPRPRHFRAEDGCGRERIRDGCAEMNVVSDRTRRWLTSGHSREAWPTRENLQHEQIE